MVEEIFTTGSEEELSNLAQSQLKESQSEDSQQIIKTLAVINYLKVTVLVIIGFILLQQIYYRLFAKGGAKEGAGRNNRGALRGNAGRQGRSGQRPFTRAEALLVMLENNGCPPEQLQTLRNTVQNQDVKVIPPEDFSVETKKREDRRVEINRPKRSVVFGLDKNMVREFKIADVVQSDERVIQSHTRNEPLTPGRLVKLKPTVVQEDSDANGANDATNENTQDSAGPAASQEPQQPPAQEENFETQSGDGSNQGEERESGEEDHSQSLLPTANEINQLDTAATISTEESKQAAPAKKEAKKSQPKFEQESRVHEDDPLSADEASSTSTTGTTTTTKKMDN